MLKQRCADLRNCLYRDPTKLIRYGVLLICCIVVIVQLYECFSKLRKPPIATHSYYVLNETITMPAVTICREPPYKPDVLGALFKDARCTHPSYTNCWRHFDYEGTGIDPVFYNGSYKAEEVFTQYGLNGEMIDVEVSSAIHFHLGQCHTLRPKVPSISASKKSGYSIMLKHDKVKQPEETNGWHLFFHEPREDFTELRMKAFGRIDYVFVEVEEEIDIKIQSQHFKMISTIDTTCSDSESYSDLKCGEFCVWRDVAGQSRCSGPWMPGIDLPRCSNYTSMRNLTVAYDEIYESEEYNECDCVGSCKSTIYSTFVQNRKDFYQPQPSSQVWIYYTTKLITKVEERPSYDATQFIADMGGSLGFLLGLSVLGLIGILEHITLMVCGNFIKRMESKRNEHSEQEGGEKRSNLSDATVEASFMNQINKY